MHINLFNQFKYNPGKPSQKQSNSGDVRIQTLAYNDVHGNLPALSRLKTEVDRFVSSKPQGVIRNVVDAGDASVGAHEQKNRAIVAITNEIAPVRSPGNHEWDFFGSKGYSKMLDNAKFKTLALNLVPKTGSEFQDDIDAGRLAKSHVVDENGVKIGYIGLIPCDLKNRLNKQCKDNSTDIDVLPLNETIKAVQEEVNKLEAQGVKIIHVISHMGYDADVELIKNVAGVDIVNGGHSHTLLDGIVPGKNYFISKRGEPVILTQAFKNGHYVGYLDVEYKNGIIDKAKYEVKNIDNNPQSLVVKMIENMYLGAPKVIGTMAHSVKALPEYVLEESPLNSFLCDGYKKYTGAQIVFNNLGTMRYSMPEGQITDRQVMDILPYYNDVFTYKLSEKDIITALNGAIEAAGKYNRTGALQVSGLRYTIGKDNKVKEVFLVNDDGSEEKLNSDNPSSDKFFTVAYNSFLGGGTEGLAVLNAPEKIVSKCDRTETDIFRDYIASFNNQPISIEKTGRIVKES